MTEPTPGLGHNNPPTPAEQMAAEQSQLYADKLRELQRILEKAKELPKDVTDDETAGPVQDYVKIAKQTVKELDAIRLNEKKKYTVFSDAIQGFWKKKTEGLEEKIAEISEPLGKYLKKKEDDKRREAEEKAERERIEAQRLQKIAEENERKEREAKEAAEAENKRLREEAEEKERLRLKAIDDAKKAEEDRIRKIQEDADRKVREAKEAQEKAEREQREAEQRRKDELLQAEEDRKAEDARLKAAKDAADKAAKDAEKAMKESTREIKAVQKETSQEIKSIDRETKKDLQEIESTIQDNDRDVRAAERKADVAADDFKRADRHATKLEKVTELKGAAFSRTRGDGSVASVSERWVGRVANRDELDLEALREHIPFDALDSAVQSAVNAGAREIKGAVVYIEDKVNVR